MVEIFLVLGVATACVVVGTLLIGEVAPKTGYGDRDTRLEEASMKRDLQRIAIRWLQVYQHL